MPRIKNFQGRNFNKKRNDDRQSLESRSTQMSSIRSKGTKLELLLISILKSSLPNKFRTNVKNIKGKPDVVFEKEKICIFLDSDFWHGWQYSRWEHLLKNDFWKDKIINNRKRDKKVTLYLKNRGWKVMRIWEHQLRDKDKVLNKLKFLIKPD